MDFDTENEWLTCGESAKQIYLLVKRQCPTLPDKLSPERGEQFKSWRNRVKRFYLGVENTKGNLKSFVFLITIFLLIPVATPLMYEAQIFIDTWIIMLGLFIYFLLGIPICLGLNKKFQEQQLRKGTGCLLRHIEELFGQKLTQITEMKQELLKKKALKEYRKKVNEKLDPDKRNKKMAEKYIKKLGDLQ